MNHEGAVTYRHVAGSSCRLDCGVQSTEADAAPWADNVGVHVDQQYAHGCTFADSHPTANKDILTRRSSVPRSVTAISKSAVEEHDTHPEARHAKFEAQQDDPDGNRNAIRHDPDTVRALFAPASTDRATSFRAYHLCYSVAEPHPRDLCLVRTNTIRAGLDLALYSTTAQPPVGPAADKTLTRRSSVPRQDGIDAPNEGKEFRHVLAEKLGGRVIRHFATLVDKTRCELDVGFDRVHLR